MKRLLGSMLAAFAIAIASPAAAQSGVQRDYDTVAALVQALPTTINGETRTAQPHESVFAQQVRVTEVARLRAPLQATYPVVGLNVDMSLPEGAELFRVRPTDRPELRMFCSPDTVRTDRNGYLPSVGRTCLSDDDNDGAFDRFWYQTVAISGGGNGDGGWTVTPFAHIAGGLAFSAPERFSTPYSVVESHSIAPFAVEIEYSGWFGQPYFQRRAREGEELVDIGSDAFSPSRINEDARYPALLTLLGAEIEIISVAEDRSIIYRVRRGFTETEPLQLMSVPPPAPPPPPPAPSRRNQ